MYNLRVYKVGNYYKYIGLPVIDSKIDKNYVNKDILCKTNNNLIRAKTTIKDLILCNNFKYFITITINSNYNRFDLTNLRRLVSQAIRNKRRNNNLRLDFLFVPEQHKNGAWHLHGVLSGDFSSFVYENVFHFYSCKLFDNIGFNSVSVIKDISRVGSYISKYITKDIQKLHKFKHCFFTSHNLNRPVQINSVFYNNNYFNINFFDYLDNFCGVKYDNKLYNVFNLLQF